MSSYSEGQIHLLANALESTKLTPEEVTMIIQGKAQLPHFLEVLRGHAKILLTQLPEEKNDTIIRVNLYVNPAYPKWMRSILKEDSEHSGPREYDISMVEEWYHPVQKQEGRQVKGVMINNSIVGDRTIEDHLGLADLLAIQAKGIAFFRKYFGGKAVFGWKSLVWWNDHNFLSVPYLVEDGDEVIVDRRESAEGWASCDPALRFASK
jgi:hypothetical protein